MRPLAVRSEHGTAQVLRTDHPLLETRENLRIAFSGAEDPGRQRYTYGRSLAQGRACAQRGISRRCGSMRLLIAHSINNRKTPTRDYSSGQYVVSGRPHTLCWKSVAMQGFPGWRLLDRLQTVPRQ